MSAYQDMTKVAAYIAPASMDEWKKDDIEYMVEECGAEATEDFFQFYGNKYGICVDKQIKYIAECWEEECEGE